MVITLFVYSYFIKLAYQRACTFFLTRLPWRHRVPANETADFHIHVACSRKATLEDPGASDPGASVRCGTSSRDDIPDVVGL